jgi:hypothetical protein
MSSVTRARNDTHGSAETTRFVTMSDCDEQTGPSTIGRLVVRKVKGTPTTIAASLSEDTSVNSALQRCRATSQNSGHRIVVFNPFEIINLRTSSKLQTAGNALPLIEAFALGEPKQP